MSADPVVAANSDQIRAYHPQTTNIILTQPINQRRGQLAGTRAWSTGVFGCCEDLGICCCAWWCYPCFLCQLASQSGEFFCGPWCWRYSHPNPFISAMRSKMRGQYGITGSVCDDLLCVCCCEPCVACQMNRELKHASQYDWQRAYITTFKQHYSN